MSHRSADPSNFALSLSFFNSFDACLILFSSTWIASGNLYTFVRVFLKYAVFFSLYKFAPLPSLPSNFSSFSIKYVFNFVSLLSRASLSFRNSAYSSNLISNSLRVSTTTLGAVSALFFLAWRCLNASALLPFTVPALATVGKFWLSGVRFSYIVYLCYLS